MLVIRPVYASFLSEKAIDVLRRRILGNGREIK